MSVITRNVPRCPVCGSEAALIDSVTDGVKLYTVICINVEHCGLGSGFCRTESEALENWDKQREYADTVRAERRDKA